jgi:acyl-coenzyme A synthetase/AMP-(fatty) acid ligase
MLWGAGRSARLADILYGSGLGGRAGELAGLSVLVRTSDAFSAALALIELDGAARRIVLCPPDVKDADLPHVIAIAEVDAVVYDREPPPNTDGLRLIAQSASFTPLADDAGAVATEWVMFTSGTTGVPKMVIHTLASLTGAINTDQPGDPSVVWGTFYDIRRYGGLQILLRALLGEGSMVLSKSGEPIVDFLARLARHGVTHLTGTPSHWRGVLMSSAAGLIAPRYIRMSGEIADQAILDSLKAVYPGVPIGHAYASTEAGVGFEVDDGLEGFPAAFMDRKAAPVEMKLVDGSLRLRSARAAGAYVGGASAPLAEDDGFIDTGDMLERRGDRFYFIGRRGGVINVGGLKVHPEEIEAVINSHPSVRMSLVKGRRNPITGSIVVADVVLDTDAAGPDPDLQALKSDILRTCRETLAAYKAPASLRFVSHLEVTSGGKLERTHA